MSCAILILLSAIINILRKVIPNDERLVQIDNFCESASTKKMLDDLEPETQLEVLEVGIACMLDCKKKLERKIANKASPLLEEEIGKFETHAYELHLNILRDQHSFDKFDNEMKEKEIIGADLGVMKKKCQPNLMIVLGFIIIIAESKKHYKTQCRDKNGRIIIITYETIKKALLKKYKIKDNKMMRRDPDECKGRAMAYLQTLREHNNSTTNYFNK